MVTKAEVEKVLRAIQDPELGMDIFTLGLIYKAEVNGDVVNIEMTFTSPMCPYGPQLVREIKEKIGQIKGVKEARVEVVFSPPWQPSEEVRMMLGV